MFKFLRLTVSFWWFSMISLVLLLPVFGFAEEPSEKETLSLGEVLEIAAQDNPEIRAAWQEYQSQRPLSRVKGALDDPKISWTRFQEGVQTRTGVQQNIAGISQSFPFPGKLSTKSRVAQIEAKKARVAFDRQVREVVASLKKLYAELWYFRQAKQIAAANKRTVDLTIGQGSKEPDSDNSVLQETLRAQQQQAQISYDVLTFEELAEAKLAQLNALLNRPSSTPLIPETLPPPPSEENLDRWWELALAHQEDLKTLEFDVEIAAAKTRLARLSRLPNLTLGYNVIKIGGRPDLPAGRLPGEGIDARGFSFGINLPIWEGKNKAEIRSAKAATQAKKFRLESRKNKIQADLKEMWLLLKNSKRLLQLYEENLIPQARLALSTAEVDFKEERRSMVEFLEAQSVLYAFQLAAVKAKIDLFLSWVDIERTIGKIPESLPEKVAEQ